jgi:hypothetical protein
MFTAYELAGVFTNLAAGTMGKQLLLAPEWQRRKNAETSDTAQELSHCSIL